MRQAVFLIQTPDRKGVLAGVTGFFYQQNLNILQCRQYTDMQEERYYMRISVELGDSTTRHELENSFAEFAREHNLEYSVRYPQLRQNMAIMVSKTSHCLYDLLMHASEGAFGSADVRLVISNHPDLEEVADRFRIPFFCIPVGEGGQAAHEKKVLELLEKHNIDLVVLARYMRVLTDDFIDRYPQKIINIHHAFLPAFQGGNPYFRAWERGVKMIGATAHYATAELDEGPIIEQDVERITHEDSPEELREIGRDIERRVLTRAVRAHLEHRIIVSGCRTIVFAK